MGNNFKNDRWQNDTVAKELLALIDSLYETKRPPFCYPGTPLPKDILEYATNLMGKHINAIGSHTHNRDGEGGFDVVQEIEARAIYMLASVLGIQSPDKVDGYFCGGGTEANEEGMWIGRQFLRQFNDPSKKGIAIFTSPLLHYSIVKATELLDMGSCGWDKCNKCGENHIFTSDERGCGLNLVGLSPVDKSGMTTGEMSVESLKEAFHQKYSEGFRRFMVIATVGTSVMGSIDPIEKIGEFINKAQTDSDAHFYFHVDASFAGFTVPFVKPNMKIAFQVPEVNSVTMDGDKMGRLPYPGGIFLCRKGLMALVGRRVQYIRGNEDDTISGSRSCLSPVLAYLQYTEGGTKAQTKYVHDCLHKRDMLVEMIRKRLPWIHILHCSPWVNFAPMIINIENDNIPKFLLENKNKRKMEGFLEPYHLRSDFVPVDPKNPNSCGNKVYKICVMPHHTAKQIVRFVDDLEKANLYWKEMSEC